MCPRFAALVDRIAITDTQGLKLLYRRTPGRRAGEGGEDLTAHRTNGPSFRSRRFDFSNSTDMRRLNKGAALDDARPPLPRFSDEALLPSQSAVLNNKQGRTQQ